MKPVKKKNAPKKTMTRPDRNTPEAAAEENSKPYDEIGKTEEEIREENQGEVETEPGKKVGPVPTGF